MSVTNPNSYTIDVKDKKVTLTFIGNQFQPDFSEVTGVIAICFTADGKLVAVNIRKRGWDLPGGHVEEGETDPITTLNREVMEEAYMTVTEPQLVEVIQSDYFDDRKSYMLVYAALVDEMLEFVPTDEVSARQAMDVEEFIDQYQAGDKRLVRQAILEAKRML